MNPGGVWIIVTTCAAVLLTAAPGLAGPTAPHVVYNPTPSLPRGFYRVVSPGELAPGRLVVTRLPEPAEALADARRYLPAGTPLVKTVAAGPGAWVFTAETKPWRSTLTSSPRWPSEP